MARDGVLLLHGIEPLAWPMQRMVRALRAAGYDVCACDYPSRRHDLHALAAFVADSTAAWRVGLNGRLHFVTHSMGGLVARVLVGEHPGFAPPRLGRTVQIAPPNNGSEIADLLAPRALYRWFYGPAGGQLGTGGWGTDPLAWPPGCPLAVIAGTRSLDPVAWLVLPKPNDGRVSVASTRLPGAAAHLVLPATHTFILRHPAAIRATLAFLRGEPVNPPPVSSPPVSLPGADRRYRGTAG